MDQKLYLECSTGISGDMTVAALLDLGANEEKLKRTLASLNIDGYTIEIGRAKKAGIDVCDFAVKLDEAHDGRDHDMEYLHGSADEHEHEHDHDHDHEHDHEHEHEHEHDHEHDHDHDHEHEHDHDHGHTHSHDHVHRSLSDITEVIEASDMTENAKQTAFRIFEILAQAESKAHGLPTDQVHFHEVGAVDSIVDIAAVAICLDDLGIQDVIVPVLCEGRGHIRCQHGELPVPVPATLNIIRDHNLNMHQMDIMGEFVTPTGAAIAAAVCTEKKLPERFRVDRIGLGGGKREYARPSILRAMLITPQEPGDDAGAWKLECNIDDCSGEAIGYAMERLFAAGAKDVNYIPLFMKKNRPGYLVTVLCADEDRNVMEEILFAETSTIGIRRQWMERTVLPREDCVMTTSLGQVNVKVVERNGEKEYLPEYESMAEIAREKGIPFMQVQKKITAEICGDK